MSSCDLIADELAALSAGIASLRNENFITRREFEDYKNRTQNGQYLLRNANFINSIIDKVWELDRRTTPQPLRDFEDRITNRLSEELAERGLLPDQGGLPRRDPIWAALDAEIRRRESEDYKLWYELRLWKDIVQIHKERAEQAKREAEESKRKAEEALNKTKALAISVGKNTAAIAKTKIDIALLKTGLAKLTAGLPALVKSIVISLIATGIFNGLVSGVMGLWNSAKLNELKLQTEVAFQTSLKAWNRANTANDKATEIDNKTKKTNGTLAILGAKIDAINARIPIMQKSIDFTRNTVADVNSKIASIVDSKIAPYAKTVGELALKVGGIVLTTAVLQKVVDRVVPRVGLNPSLNPLSPSVNPVTNPTTHNHYYYTTNNYPTTVNNYPTRETVVVNGSSQDMSWIRRKLTEIDRTTKSNLVINGIMNNKLGAQIKDGLSGWMGRFTNWSVLSRLMEFMTLAATIHNAMMLSNNLTTTLISSIQNVVNFLGLKDSEGKGYDVTVLLKQSVEAFLKSIVGEENYVNLNAAWKNANRIYQSAGNLLNSMLSFGDIVTQALQLVTGQTSKIGNALRIWGVVGEKVYGWMNPNPNFNNPILMKLNNLNEAASVVEEVSQQPQNIKDAKKEVSDNAEQLSKDIGQALDGKEGIKFPEAAKVKAEQEASKTVSKGKDITDLDLEPDEE
ncbi:MAG: hypothetical protein F6K62_18930 [Sphaerospermopsis sp. SIO1G2]|nr:hypothetical protein [Sphaerospermopsis sp. SIO1G2]